MILLFAPAFALDATVCPLPQLCDYASLDTALTAVGPIPGPHLLQVSGGPALLFQHSLDQDITIRGAPGEQLVVGADAGLTVNSGSTLVVQDLELQFTGARGTGLFVVNGVLQLTDLQLGAIDLADRDGGIVSLNGGATAVLDGVRLTPVGGAQLGSGSAFFVPQNTTLTLNDGTFGNLRLSAGHLFDVDGGTVTATGFELVSAESNDGPVLARIHNGGSFTLTTGSLGTSTTAPAISTEKEGGLFRVDGATLSLSGVTVASMVAENGGVVWSSGNASLAFTDVDVASVDAFGHGAILRQDGGSFVWTGGSATSVVSDDGGALFQVAGSAVVTDVQFTSVQGTNGPAVARSLQSMILEGVTVDGAVSATAAVEGDATLAITHSAFVGGTGGEAAHVWMSGSLLTVDSSTFELGDCTGPSSTRGASSVVVDDSDAVITGSSFTSNGDPASVCRGALQVDGTATLSGVTFEGNQHAEVGAIEVDQASALLQGTLANTFSNNIGPEGAISGRSNAALGSAGHGFAGQFSSNQGGAIRFAVDTDVWLAASSFEDNDTLAAGGAIRVGTDGTLTAQGTTFARNRAEGRGGAVAFESGGEAELTDCVFASNTAGTSAGAAYFEGLTTLDEVRFEDNVASTNGGAVNCQDTFIATGGSFLGNAASSSGGALYCGDASVTLDGVRFDGNRGDSGAAVYVGVDGDLVLRDARISGNEAAGRAAVFVREGGTTLVEQTLFCGNLVGQEPGGLYTTGSGGTTVAHSAFAQHGTYFGAHLSEVDANSSVTQSNFYGPALWVTDGSRNVEVRVERSLFTGFASGSEPVRFDDFDPQDTAVFTDSLLGLPWIDPAPNVATSGLVEVDPDLLPAPVDCSTASLEDVIAGPLSPAWTRDDPDDHFGAFLPAWGVNADADASVAYWDCEDGDADDEPAVNREAIEDCGNGIDDDCDGSVDCGPTYYPDHDGDGFGDGSAIGSPGPGPGLVSNGDDCDDGDASVSPQAAEVCNGIDDDCSGTADDGLPTVTSYPDADRDGFAADDAVANVGCDVPMDFVDVQGDCDDDDASSYPTAPELCDDVDHDCDGATDPATVPVWYTDDDGDGYGAGAGVEDCVAPPDTVALGGDCDDLEPAVNPAAREACNAVDDDCSGTIDDGLPVLDWYLDGDGDGYGAGVALQVCDGRQGADRVAVSGDCNDQAATISPGADELCDGIDNDCDTFVDADDLDVVDAAVFYEVDADGDGWGVQPTAPQCVQPAGTVRNGPDCDDTNALVFPTAPEACIDDLDNDCDGLVDVDDPDFTGEPLELWEDADGDGYGNPNAPLQTCGAAGYVLPGLEDCDDAQSGVNPAATEVCDGIDNNCNTFIDGADINTPPVDGIPTYTDTDGDGFGGALRFQRLCDPAAVAPFTSLGGGDCDDSADDVNPAATEDCSETDFDCSGSPYDAAIVHHLDSDADGFGDPASATEGCFPDDARWILESDDCDDSDPTSFPGAPEACDGIDHDCDGDPWQGEDVVWQVDRDCDGVIGALEITCDPADLPDLGACDPVVHDGSSPTFDCDDTDPEVTACTGPPPPKRVADQGCRCDSGSSGSWLGLLVLLYGVRKRRSGRERRVG